MRFSIIVIAIMTLLLTSPTFAMEFCGGAKLMCTAQAIDSDFGAAKKRCLTNAIDAGVREAAPSCLRVVANARGNRTFLAIPRLVRSENVGVSANRVKPHSERRMALNRNVPRLAGAIDVCRWAKRAS
jgi:hypothetical protein